MNSLSFLDAGKSSANYFKKIDLLSAVSEFSKAFGTEVPISPSVFDRLGLKEKTQSRGGDRFGRGRFGGRSNDFNKRFDRDRRGFDKKRESRGRYKY